MGFQIIILSEVGQAEKSQVSYDIAYMWNLKKCDKWTYLQNRIEL